jgi:hypothetical protein
MTSILPNLWIFLGIVNLLFLLQMMLLYLLLRGSHLLHYLQRESNNSFPVDYSTSTRPGWNSTHRYVTRFRKKHLAHTCLIDDSSDATPLDKNLYSAFIAVQDSYPIHSGTELSFLEHFSCAAQSNPDVLYFGSMLRDPDRSHFETDMIREVSDLIQTNTVELTLCSCIPLGLKILPVIWSFRWKWAPDWSIIKHKARLCPHGGHQIEGEHFWATYAPVVNWRTVLWVLVLSLLADLKSRQIL